LVNINGIVGISINGGTDGVDGGSDDDGLGVWICFLLSLIFVECITDSASFIFNKESRTLEE